MPYSFSILTPGYYFLRRNHLFLCQLTNLVSILLIGVNLFCEFFFTLIPQYEWILFSLLCTIIVNLILHIFNHPNKKKEQENQQQQFMQEIYQEYFLGKEEQVETKLIKKIHSFQCQPEFISFYLILLKEKRDKKGFQKYLNILNCYPISPCHSLIASIIKFS